MPYRTTIREPKGTLTSGTRSNMVVRRFILTNRCGTLSSLLFYHHGNHFRRLPDRTTPPMFQRHISPGSRLPYAIFIIRQNVYMRYVNRIYHIHSRTIRGNYRYFILPRRPRVVSVVPRPLNGFYANHHLYHQRTLYLRHYGNIRVLLSYNSGHLYRNFSPFLVLYHPDHFQSNLQQQLAVHDPH